MENRKPGTARIAAMSMVLIGSMVGCGAEPMTPIGTVIEDQTQESSSEAGAGKAETYRFENSDGKQIEVKIQ
jgi:hypothetical protein